VHLSGYPQYSTSGLIIGGIALLVMVGVGFASWYQARSANKLLSWHLYLFGGVWLLLFLLPPLLRYDSTRDFDYLEHRTYCSLVGGVMCYAAALTAITQRYPTRIVQLRSVTGCATLALAFAVFTIDHAQHFANPTTFWTHAVTSYPTSATANSTLATVLLANKAPMETVEPLYRKAVEKEPTNARYLNTLAAIHALQGRLDEAEHELNKAILIDSSNADVAYNLGYTLRKKYGDAQLRKAIGLFKRAIDLQPRYEKAYTELLVALINTGEMEQAQAYYKKATQYGVNVEKSLPTIRQYVK